MDVYSRLMDIDEVVECLNRKIDTDLIFNKKKAITFLKNKDIPIVFEYEGWGTWNFNNKGEYQSLNIKLKGYFNIQYDIDAINLFRGSVNNILLGEARIYRLDSHYINANELNRIRHNPLDGLEPKEGDHILFETGGRAPIFAYQNFIDVYTNKATIFEEDSSKSKGKVGVLKVDLEDHLKKKDIKAMENDTEMEALESKIEKLESKNEKLKSENASLIQQLEKLAADNVQIANLKNELAQSKSDKRSYTTPAINIMNKVIAKFWVNYSTDQPAPKQSTITAWIIDNFDEVSSALALNIDKVCRPASAKSGGKYKR